jgi:DNA recombination protein RmuC
VLYVFLAIAAAAAFATGWLVAYSRAAARHAASTAALREELARAQATLSAERANSADKLAVVQRAEASLRDAFAALSAEALKQNNESFLTLARSALETAQYGAKTDLDARQKEIAAMVEPVRQTLDKLEGRLHETGKDQSTLRGHLRSVVETQELLRQQTQSLVNALKSPNQRGRWGEVQLRNVLERAGMLPYCDFIEKDPADDGDGRRFIPDVRVRMPNEASLVIDSKVPIDAWLRLTEADEASREGLLVAHARQVREHIRALGAKNYWSRFEPSPEFVVMFVPAEPLFTAALQKDPTLFDFAVDQRVVPASPLTLVALLRTVASAWQQQRLARNAEEIRLLGKELYERLTTMAQHIADVGLHLKRAGECYDDFVGSLDSRVLVSARRFRELGVSAVKDLPDVPSLHVDVREPRAPELRVPTQETFIDAELSTLAPEIDRT